MPAKIIICASFCHLAPSQYPNNKSGIQRRVMSTRLYPPSQFLSSHGPSAPVTKTCTSPCLRLRVDELIGVTRMEHILRALCSFWPYWPLICGISKRGAFLASSESAKRTLKAGPPASRIFSAYASFCLLCPIPNFIVAI